MLFGVVGVFISFGIISAGWCTWTTSLLCDIYMLHRFVLAFLRSPGTLVLSVASISISWTIWRYCFWRNSEETLFSAQFCCEDSTLVVRFLLEQDKLLTCVYAVVHVRWMLSERKEEPSDVCSRVICLLQGPDICLQSWAWRNCQCGIILVCTLPCPILQHVSGLEEHHKKTDYFVCLHTAIGTIFSATDSVCTLQVGPLVIKHLLQNPPYFHK